MGSWSISWSATGSRKAEPAILPASFYGRDTVQVAKDLVGKVLLVKNGAEIIAGRIIETEAYRGDDPASHSSRGETPRSSVMFGDPGIAYVYFIYGMYEMLNFVTEKKGFPGAVLIRALEPLEGEPAMKKRRKVKSRIDLTNGPGKLTRAFGIKMAHNRKSLQGPDLFVFDDGYRPSAISCSPRVGISLGTERLWRFFEAGNGFVSRAPQNAESMPVAQKGESRVTG